MHSRRNFQQQSDAVLEPPSEGIPPSNPFLRSDASWAGRVAARSLLKVGTGSRP